MKIANALSGHMRPDHPMLHFIYQGWRNAKLPRNGGLRFCAGSYESNKFVCQLRHGPGNPFANSFMRFLVMTVFRRGCPPQIVKPSIEAVAVTMRALHALWARPLECLKNQSMNKGWLGFLAIFFEVNDWVSACCSGRLSAKHFFRKRQVPVWMRRYVCVASDSPKAGDGVSAAKPHSKSPNFIFHKNALVWIKRQCIQSMNICLIHWGK